MNVETKNTVATAQIMHEILNNVSTIMSISQLALINNGEMPPELQIDLKRIVTTARDLSTHIQDLAHVLDEED